jgi:hypothetical protein
VRHVLRAEIDLLDRDRIAVGHRPRRVRDDGLDRAFQRFGELLARAREDLDAVVLERIVDCARQK